MFGNTSVLEHGTHTETHFYWNIVMFGNTSVLEHGTHTGNISIGI